MAPTDRKRRKIQIAGSLDQWKEATGNSGQLPSTPRKQSVPSQNANVDIPIDHEDLGDKSDMSNNVQPMNAPKRRAARATQKEGLTM